MQSSLTFYLAKFLLGWSRVNVLYEKLKTLSLYRVTVAEKFDIHRTWAAVLLFIVIVEVCFDVVSAHNVFFCDK